MQDIKVSVVMLCYNHGKYVRQAIESVANQKTDFAYEIIVHDDASTDGSADIIRELAQKYPDKLVPICQEVNQHSQNIPFTMRYINPRIRGQYVAYCECDDYWCDENKLQKQVDILEKDPSLSACVHNCYLIDENGDSIGDVYNSYRLCRAHRYTLRMFAVGAFFPGQTASVLYRRDRMQYLSDEQRDDYLHFRFRAGDLKRNFHLLLQGDIWYMEDRMSVHRVVLSGDGSWSARNRKKNQAFARFASSRDFRRYAKKYYGRRYPNYYTTFRAGVYAISKRLRRPTDTDKEIFRKVASEVGGVVPLVFYLLGVGVLALPLAIERRLDRKKYSLKQ